MDMIAQHTAQRGIQQMGGRVGAHDGVAALSIHMSPDRIAQL